jgi:hypothetical protein
MLILCTHLELKITIKSKTLLKSMDAVVEVLCSTTKINI